MRSGTGSPHNSLGPVSRLTTALVWLVVVLGVSTVACSVPMPSADSSIADRFTWAQKRFDQGDYRGAIRGFEDFLLRDPLNVLADSAHVMEAEAYLRSGQPLQAAVEFTKFAKSRPNSPLADDAQFGACRAEWALSPNLPRDQESTTRAIEVCRDVDEYFPRSRWVSAADSIVSAARTKMAEKEYQIGSWYYSRGFYESANIYFEDALSSYPGSRIEPEVLASLYRSYRRIGYDREAEETRQKLLSQYGDSPAAAALRGHGTTGSSGPP